jgi:hypothetical protein
MEQVVQANVEQPYGLGPANPDSLLLSSVDSLRFPIQRIYSQLDASASEMDLREIEVIDRIRQSANLAQLYSIVEGYWMHALWNGWYVESTTQDDADLILPPEEERPIIAASSQYRREVLMLEFFFHFSHQWKRVLTEKEQHEFLSSLPKITITGEGSERNLAVSRREQADNTAMMMLENALQAERGYYLPLVNEPLAKLGTVDLHLLLDAWQVLFALSEALIDTLPSVNDSGVYSIEKLLKYAPTIRISELIKLFMSWCYLNEEIAQRLVEFFSYGPNQKRELWGHPLIKTNDDELIPLLAPIRYGNIERTFELWMKDSGLKLSDKGPLFEEYIRPTLTRALSRSRVLKDAAVHPTSLILRGSDGVEEIDVVLRIRNTVLLGEAKCLLFPADPIEFSRYFDVLADAALQVLRKVDFANRHRELLAKTLGIPGIPTDNLVIQPFILVNQPFGSGFVQNSVPVVDEFILTRFFEGTWDRMASYTDANELEAGFTFHLYSNEEEAASNIFAYLENPPQIQHYWTNIKPIIQWYPAVDELDRKIAAAHLEVVLPLPDLNFNVGSENS